MATSKKPTGLQIDRRGNKIIFSWSKPETYGDGQQLQWFYTAPSKIWQSAIIKLGKSAKNYTVTAPSKYNKITFGVRGNHDQNSKDPGWSDWATKSFAVYPPKKPTVSAAWSAGTPDKTTFTYEAKDDEHHPFDHVEYRTKWIKDFNGKPASYSWTGAVSTSSTKTGTIFNSTETIPAGQSYTRVVQCRTVGPGGVVKDPWVFKWHTYAKPNAPVITSTKGTVEDKTKSKITLNLSWTTSAPSSRPIDKIVIEYLITAPGADMSVPAGTNFQEADTPAKKGANSWAEEIDSTLADDQVLFARIHVYHDTREDWSDPVIALKGRLAAPTNVSITPMQGTHTITVNATNASTVPDSYLAVTYKKGTSDAVMGIIPHGSSTVNMIVPAWTDAVGSVGVRAVVGSYTAQPADSEGVVVYTIAKPQMTSDRVWKGTLTAPTINVVQSDIESTAIVTWDWSDSNATDAEVSWSDHADAWDSTDEPETFVVNNSKASRLSVSGLETGIDLYFRVRLMQTVGDDTSYGLYSDTFVLNLASAPAVPVLEMSSQVIDPAGEAIASWVYISRDNTMQAHATIAEVDTSTTPWTYTPILQADEEQQAVIRPSDLEWAVGDYQLAVQVQSASGRWSEYSDPIPVTVREPLTCSISDTSLVYDSIPVNPEEYTGNPVIFNTGDLEKEVVSLDVELLPKQEGTPTQDSTIYNEPYLSKTSPSFNSEYDKLIGGTVAWNQLLSTSSGEQKKKIYSGMFSTDNVAIYNGHRYLVSFLQPAGCGVYRQNRTNFTVGYLNYSAPTVATLRQFIATATGTSTESFGGLVSKLETTEELYQLTRCMIIDLTAMFGSTIADYIYSLETATAGAGVAWFKKLFPKSYYEYNAGELMSVKTSEHQMVGFNQWDEEWELGYLNSSTGMNASSNDCIRAKNYNKILPQTTYYAKMPTSSGVNIKLFFYDADKSFISWSTEVNETFVTPANAHYLRFYMSNQYGTTYNHDICVNLSWDGSRNGEYEPYDKHSYPLDTDLTLRGIPKLDANNNLYYDGDVYEPDGTVTRKYGIVDLGTLTWEKHPSMDNVFFTRAAGTTTLDTMMKTAGAFLNTKYPYGGTYSAYNAFADKVAYSSTSFGRVGVKDTKYSTAEEFKTAMNGVYLVYELATPTTETADPYQNPQEVGTTESYTDNRAVPIPVGHESTYANIYPITGYDNTIITDSNGTDTTTTTVTLPHTVYGADVDVTGGNGTEKWHDLQPTITSLQSINSYGIANFLFTFSQRASNKDAEKLLAISNALPIQTSGIAQTQTEGFLIANSEAGYVRLSSDKASTVAQANQWIQDNDFNICYILATPTDLQTTPADVELYKGDNVISSDGEMTMEIADAVLDGYFLKEMPMTVTVTGAGAAGQTVLTLKRKADYVIMKPDETELVGHADEVICQHVYTGEAQQTISIDEVQGKLNDGATYYIEATVTDDLGRQASDRYPNDDPDDYFKVIWDEQAIMPEATAEIINNDYAKLTITKPQDWADGDVVDIYRMTSDKPQKIAEDVEMDDDPVEYVDPYPTLGENGGYRFVYKTINGDDTLDADDNFAWLDVPAVCHSAEAMIDFNGERIPLPYNLKVSNSWGKDFQETRYLGGHIAGDWTAGVSRSGSIDTVTVPLNDPAVFRSIRRLAQYTELCHVRTLDGSVMTCNVDVDDDFGYDTAGKIQEVKLDFTRVDPVDLDAVPLDDWLVTP